MGTYLRATVPRTTGGNATTLHTAPVVASSATTAATATFASGNASPVSGDAGGCLRAFVYYSNGSGTRTRAATGFTGAVTN